MRNLALTIRERARTRGQHVAMRVKRDGAWREISYSRLDEEAGALAQGLVELGLAVGGRVAILAPNIPEWTLADLAIQSVRGVSVPVYATNTDEQVRQIVDDAGAEIAFAGTQELAVTLSNVRNLGGLPRKIVVVEGALPDPNLDQSYSDLVAQGSAAGSTEADARAASACAEDLATIIYTSGTTGEPKGVMLAHDNFVNQFDHLDEHFRVETSDRSLCFLPLSHVYERAWSFYVLFKGASNSYVVNPRDVAEYLLDVKPTVMVAVPRLYEKVHTMIHAKVESAPPLRRRLFHWAVRTGAEYQDAVRGPGAGTGLKLRHAVADRLVLLKIRTAMGGDKNVLSSGGAPLAKEVEEFFLAAGMLICQGYGLTETAPMLTCNKPHEFRFGSVGKPIRGVEIRIAEKDGEILARGPNVMRGYFGKPEATAEAIVDGWFHTGDVGYVDDDGFLVITDRIKDLIVTSGGKNVAPQRIETILSQDPYVEQLAVVGDRRNYLGALVVPSFEALSEWASRQRLRFQDHADLIKLPEVISFMDERIRERCNQLAPFERIRKITLLSQPFSMEKGEMTPTLKVRRKAIADAYHDLIDRMFL